MSSLSMENSILLIEQLAAYSRAIRAGDADTLHDLLKEGRERKEQIDKERF